MKRIVLFVSVALIGFSGVCQKKKTASKKKAPISGFAKADNIVAEVKTGNFQLTINDKVKPDNIVVKSVEAKFSPIDCKLAAFTAAGTKLYLLSWTEKAINKGDNKTEDISTVYSMIYDIASKKQVFANSQMTNHITEILFLDKNKTATQTQEKIRREGYEFILNPDGSVTQKNKTQQNNFVYNKEKMEFVLKRN